MQESNKAITSQIAAEHKERVQKRDENVTKYNFEHGIQCCFLTLL